MIVQSVILLLLPLVAGSVTKQNGRRELLTRKDIQQWSCSCDLLTAEAKLLHDYPDIWLPADLVSHGMTVHSQCKAIRHFCRDQCSSKMDLRQKTDHQTLGYQLCAAYGKPTDGDGVQIYGQATLNADGEYCHPHRAIKSTEVKDKLCCAHTTIDVEHHSILAFGWNPDCKAATVIVGN